MRLREADIAYEGKCGPGDSRIPGRDKKPGGAL